MLNLPCRRLFAAVPDASAARACSTSSATTLRRWHGKTKQVVDVLPKEALYEQELGLIALLYDSRIYNDECTKNNAEDESGTTVRNVYFVFFLTSLGFLLPYPTAGISPTLTPPL